MRSLMGNMRWIEKSRLNVAGPERILRPTLPNVPAAAVLKASVVNRTTDEQASTVLPGPDLLVTTGDGVLVLEQVQPAGKRPMAGADWKRGQSGLVGRQLGNS